MYALALAWTLPVAQADVDVLLKSKWDQRATATTYAPRGQRLGCDSTAWAQIMYYYQRCPTGAVSYRAPGYDTTSMNFDHENGLCNWNNFAVSDNHATAKFQYANALIVEKKWGTGSYMLSHSGRLDAVKRHYGVSATEWSMSEDGRDEFASRIRSELDARKPLLMHIRQRSHGSTSGYHWVIVDGYRSTGSKGLTVHLNLGHGGSDNGWFDFDRAIGEYDDVGYKELIAIHGASPPSPTSGTEGVWIYEVNGSGKLFLDKSVFRANSYRGGALAWDGCGAGAAFDNGHPVWNDDGSRIGGVAAKGTTVFRMSRDCALSWDYPDLVLTAGFSAKDGRRSFGGFSYLELSTSIGAETAASSSVMV